MCQMKRCCCCSVEKATAILSILGILGGLGNFLGASNHYGYAVNGVVMLLCYGLSLFTWYKHNSGAKPNPTLMIPSLVLIIIDIILVIVFTILLAGLYGLW